MLTHERVLCVTCLVLVWLNAATLHNNVIADSNIFIKDFIVLKLSRQLKSNINSWAATIRSIMVSG